MYNPGEITSFCSKSCNLRPSSNLFTNVMQNQGRIYHMAQCQGPHAQMVSLFFSFHQYLAGRCSENPQSAGTPARNVNPATVIT